MHDQRVVGGPPLDGEDPARRRRVRRVGGEAVHGLGRDRDQSAAAQRVDRASTSVVTSPSRRQSSAGRRRGTRASASMKPNDSGVAKWSMLRSTTQRRVRAAPSTSGSPGPAKSRSPMTTSAGHVTAAELVRVNGPRRGRRITAASAAVVARLLGVLGEQPGRCCPPGRRCPRAGDDRAVAAVVVARTVPADPGEHEPAEPVGLRRPRAAAASSRRARTRPRRPARRERVDDPRGEVGVGLRLVRLRRGAVAEQVDADHLRPASASRCGEAAALPRVANEPPQPWTSTTGDASRIPRA